jgi:hypothetical protein
MPLSEASSLPALRHLDFLGLSGYSAATFLQTEPSQADHWSCLIIAAGELTMMKETDRIIGRSRGTANEALAYAKRFRVPRLSFTNEYIRVVYTLCQPSTMPDAAIVIAQIAHETTYGGKPWNSYWWRTRGNPAGLGITGNAYQNNRSAVFETGTEAARAHVAHLLLYATGFVNRGGLTPRDDPRYAAYVNAYGNVSRARTIAGLSRKWAVDARYSYWIVRHGNAIFRG